MKRSLSLVCVLCMVVALLSGCSGDSDKPTLTVYNWGDYIDEEVNKMFEEEFDCNVVYATFEQNEDMYTKIKNSDSTYDVVIPSDYMIERMIKEDMLAPLDKEKIPNLQYINPYCMDLNFDPGNVYSVPYMWGTVGIIYNETMVDEAPTSWADLWDPAYEQNLFMMNSVRDSMMVGLLVCGFDMNTRDMSEIEQARDKLLEQKPLVLAYTGDDVKDKMIQGEAAMAVIYSGDAITIMDSDEGNPDLKYVIPEEGTNIWFDNMCVLKDSQNKDLAMEYINFMCREDIAALNRDYINYLTPQTQVYDFAGCRDAGHLSGRGHSWPSATCTMTCRTWPRPMTRCGPASWPTDFAKVSIKKTPPTLSAEFLYSYGLRANSKSAV